MFLTLLPFYRITITNSNYNEVMELSKKIPLFILCFSPYCGHCQAVKPAWNEFEEKYRQNSSIVVGSLDCIAERSLCSKLNVRAYPTFNVIINENPDAKRPPRSVNGFSHVVDEIILDANNPKQTCNRFDPFNIKYPSVVVYEKDDKPTACEFIQDLSKEDIDLPLFASFGETTNTLRKYLNSTFFVELPDYSISSAALFAKLPKPTPTVFSFVKNDGKTLSTLGIHNLYPLFIGACILLLICSYVFIKIMTTPVNYEFRDNAAFKADSHLASDDKYEKAELYHFDDHSSENQI